MNDTITATKNLKWATRKTVPVSRETSRIEKHRAEGGHQHSLVLLMLFARF